MLKVLGLNPVCDTDVLQSACNCEELGAAIESSSLYPVAQCAIRPSDFNQHIKLMLIGFRVLKHITWNTLVPQVQTELSWEQGTVNLICSQFFGPQIRLGTGCHWAATG